MLQTTRQTKIKKKKSKRLKLKKKTKKYSYFIGTKELFKLLINGYIIMEEAKQLIF